MKVEKRVICISWHDSLASTRELLLHRLGVEVITALRDQAYAACKEEADLMILGHSVPRDEKRSLIHCFRDHSSAPVLSILLGGQDKLPEATYGVESGNPQDFIGTVQLALNASELPSLQDE
jgi:hypothetical protein